MKILAAFPPRWAFIESARCWIYYDAARGEAIRYAKHRWPEALRAACAKYGYAELSQPVEVRSLAEINDDLMRSLAAQVAGRGGAF